MNREKPYIIILWEDDAWRRIALGLKSIMPKKQIHIMRPPNKKDSKNQGAKTFKRLKDNIIRELRLYPDCFVVMLMDCDKKTEKREKLKQDIKNVVPIGYLHRVFLFTLKDQPEPFKAKLKKDHFLSKQDWTFDKIGKSMGEACLSQQQGIWGRSELLDNSFVCKKVRIVFERKM